MFRANYPIELPVAGPNAPPLFALRVSAEWLPLVIGLVEYMLWPKFWLGDSDDQQQGASWALELIDIIEEATVDEVGIAVNKLATGTNAGASSAGYNARTFNTVIHAASWMSINGGQVVLLPGTYHIHITAPARGANQHRLRLRDSVATTTYQYGGNEDANAIAGVVNVGNHATLDCVRTITASASLVVEHYITTALATNGLGRNLNIGTELEYYESIVIRRLS